MEAATGDVARFIAKNREQITEVWHARVAKLPDLATLPPSVVVDHLPEFLLELSRWIAGDTEASQRAYVLLVQGHALTRLGHGVGLDTLLAEYQVLRELILEHVLDEAHDDKRGIIALDRAFDLAFAEAVRRFTMHRDEVRERFVGILGHDLRNPLMALTLAAETILETPCSQSGHARLAAAIRKGGERMSRMNSDLVDFALGQLGGGIPALPQTCDMADICREAVDEMRATHPDRDIKLDTTGHLAGSWDRDRVIQVISNLVANALLHGEDPIRARAYESDDRQFVITEVTNEGAPIPAELIGGLFDPFRRGARAKKGGLGLGLYIVQQIALAHGARVDVESTADGTTFRIAWPRAPLDEVARPDQ